MNYSPNKSIRSDGGELAFNSPPPTVTRRRGGTKTKCTRNSDVLSLSMDGMYDDVDIMCADMLGMGIDSPLCHAVVKEYPEELRQRGGATYSDDNSEVRVAKPIRNSVVKDDDFSIESDSSSPRNKPKLLNRLRKIRDIKSTEHNSNGVERKQPISNESIKPRSRAVVIDTDSDKEEAAQASIFDEIAHRNRMEGTKISRLDEYQSSEDVSDNDSENEVGYLDVDDEGDNSFIEDDVSDDEESFESVPDDVSDGAGISDGDVTAVALTTLTKNISVMCGTGTPAPRTLPFSYDDENSDRYDCVYLLHCTYSLICVAPQGWPKGNGYRSIYRPRI